MEGKDLMDLKKFNALIDDAYEQKEIVAKRKLDFEKEKKALAAFQEKILFILQENDMEKYASKHGTVFRVKRESVRVPKGPEEKAEFFAWLKNKGIYDELVTVNSVTLNALYKQESEVANDPDFKIPGIGESTVTFRLGMRAE